MNIRIKTTNVTMNEALNEYVMKTLSKIERSVTADPSIQCDIELARPSQHHQKGDVFRAEVRMVGKGLDEYAAAEHDDLRSAVTMVRDELVTKLRGDKNRRISYLRRSGARLKSLMKSAMPWGEDGWYNRR